MDMYYFFVFASFSFAFGCCVASFLNVCIWRLPRDESVVRPGSHCPKCNAPIRWWQNIPVVSWLALRGRCANCHEPISARYITVDQGSVHCEVRKGQNSHTPYTGLISYDEVTMECTGATKAEAAKSTNCKSVMSSSRRELIRYDGKTKKWVF